MTVRIAGGLQELGVRVDLIPNRVVVGQEALLTTLSPRAAQFRQRGIDTRVQHGHGNRTSQNTGSPHVANSNRLREMHQVSVHRTILLGSLLGHLNFPIAHHQRDAGRLRQRRNLCFRYVRNDRVNDPDLGLNRAGAAGHRRLGRVQSLSTHNHTRGHDTKCKGGLKQRNHNHCSDKDGEYKSLFLFSSDHELPPSCARAGICRTVNDTNHILSYVG